MGCPSGGLDLSAGLFAVLANPSLGVLYGEWTYGTGEAIAHTSTSKATRTTTTSTHAHHTSRSAATSTSHFSSTTSHSSAAHSSSLSTVQAALRTSSTPALPQPTSLLEEMNILFLQYSSLLEAASEEKEKRHIASVD